MSKNDETGQWVDMMQWATAKPTEEPDNVVDLDFADPADREADRKETQASVIVWALAQLADPWHPEAAGTIGWAITQSKRLTANAAQAFGQDEGEPISWNTPTREAEAAAFMISYEDTFVLRAIAKRLFSGDRVDEESRHAMGELIHSILNNGVTLSGEDIEQLFPGGD